MRYKVTSLLVGLSLSVTLLWQVAATTLSPSITSERFSQSKTKSDQKKIGILPQMLALNSLSANYERPVREYDENDTSTDTLKWSHARITEEAIKVLRNLLAQRKVLAQMPVKDLLYQMEVRRAQDVFRYQDMEEMHHQYDAVLSAVKELRNKIAYCYFGDNRKEGIDELISEELSSSCADGFYAEGFALCEFLSEEKYSWNDVVAFLNKSRPLFEGTDEQAMIDFLILKHTDHIKVSNLKSSVLSLDPEDGVEEAWEKAEKALVREYQRLIDKMTTPAYKERISTTMARVLAPEGRLRITDHDVKDGTVAVKFVAISDRDVVLTSSFTRSSRREGKKRIADRVFAPEANRVIRQSFRDTLSNTGVYHYSVQSKGADEALDHSYHTHARIEITGFELGNRNEYFAVDPLDGSPVKGIRGTLYDRSEQKVLGTVNFDDKGHATVPRQKQEMYLIIRDRRLADEQHKEYIYAAYDPQAPLEILRDVKVYTDRPIYRHGHTIKAGLLFYDDRPEGLKVVPNHSDQVFVSAERDGKEVQLATLPITTNANGVAEISYNIPKDEAYRNFSFSTRGDMYRSRHTVPVEAYKLQHLQVHIDSIPSGYVVDRPMVIYGRITNYNEQPSPGQVTVTYGTAPAEKTISQEVDESGYFEIRTEPIASKEKTYVDYLKISAIDPLGRIATINRFLRKNPTNLPLDATKLISESTIDKADFTLSTTSQPYVYAVLGNLDRYEVYAYIRDGEGQIIELGRLPINGSKKFSMPTLKSGVYTLGLRARDGYGKLVVSEAKGIAVYGRKDKQPPVPMPLWIMPYSPKDSDKEDLVVRVGSSCDLSVLMIVRDKNDDIVHYDNFRVDRGMRSVRIPRKAITGREADVQFSTIKNDEFFRENLSIPLDDKEVAQGVSIELLDGVAEFVPGAEVSRKYAVKLDGKPLADAAVLVTVFDKAVLDVVFEKSFWEMLPSPVEREPNGKIRMCEYMSLEPLEREDDSLVRGKSRRNIYMGSRLDIFDDVEMQTRSDFSETAYFTALLTTNSKGEVEFKYSLPHTQTKYVEKVFVFDKKLKAQEIKDHYFDVFAPVSVEINLPRYLTRGDKMIGEALLRNTQKSALPISYRVLIGGNELTSGTQTVGAESATAVRFEVLPEHLVGDSLSLTAQVITDGYSDAIKRTIPLRSHLMEYGVAVPFSLYKGTQVTFDLPKSDRLSSVPNLFAYFNPTNLVLTRLAQEYTMAMEREVDKLSVYGALHHFVVFSNISELFRTHPEVRASIVAALPDLHEAAKKSPSIDLDADRGHFMAQRLTDPRTLVYFYDFITNDYRLQAYLKHLTNRIKSAIHTDGGWGFVRDYSSPWLTLYVLKMLGDAPESERVPRLGKELQQSFAYLDAEYKKENNRYLSLIDYAVIRHAHGLDIKTMDKAFASRLKAEADAARKGYRNFWVSTLLRYGKFARIYGDVKHNSEVQTFINDMSRYTFSDSEQVGFELYKQARDKGTLSEKVIALLLRHKQGVIWDDTYFIEAVKLLLTHVTPTKVDRGATLTVDGRTTALTDVERAMGFVTRQLDGAGSRLDVSLGQGITTDFFFGGVVYDVTEPMIEITPTGEHLKVSKEVFARRVQADGKTSIVPVSLKAPAFKGEKLIVRYTVETNRDLSLVTIRDDRPAGSEPGYNLNGYSISDRVWWAYRRTESADHLFVDYIPRGRHVFELEATATIEGAFVYGPAEVVSYYAPEFRGNSAGGALSVAPHKRK